MSDAALSKQQRNPSLVLIAVVASLSLGGFNDKLILLPNLSYYALKSSFLDEGASGYQLPLNYKVYQGNNQAKVCSLFFDSH